MADYQHTIDQLRFRLQSDNFELTDELERLGQEYAEACRLANDRLRRCGDFLRKGLRSEAIHYAEAAPNLLEFIALLDIPEREQWDDLAALYQLPEPEPLRLEIAEQLNEAYADQQPVEKIMDRHRLLALARAPLPQRIDVLRQLVQDDPEGLFWEEDLLAMEQARFREIEATAKAAARDGDGESLKSLNLEISKTLWSEPPPAKLGAMLRKQAGRQGRADARGRLEHLAEPLLAAFSALDIAQARELRDEWDAAARIAKLEPDDHLLEEVAPALGWIADEDTRDAADRGFQDDLAALVRGLDKDDISVPSLEKLGHEVMKWERGVPEAVSTRYRNRLESLKLTETRNHRLIIGAALLALSLVVGFLGLLGYRSLQASEVQRVATAVATMIDKRELKQARALVKKHADLPALEPWIAAQRNLAEAETAESQRVAELAALMRQARGQSDHEIALALLERAAPLARSPGEKLDIADLQGEREQQLQRIMSEGEAKIRAGMAGVTESLTDLETMLDADADDGRIDDALAQISQELIALATLGRSIDSQSAAQIELLESRLAQLEQHRADAEKRIRLLKMLADYSLLVRGASGRAGELRAYGETLGTYSETFPEDPRSVDFLVVAKELPLWQGVHTWQDLLRSWQHAIPENLIDTRRRIHQCEMFLKDHPRCPSALLAQEYLSLLKTIRGRDEDADGNADAGIKSQLQNLYASELIASAYILHNGVTGTTIYTPSSREVANNELASVQYYSGFNGEIKTKTVKVEELTSRQPVLSPQGKIAKLVRARIPSVGPDQWIAFFKDLSRQIMAERKLDDFLRYFLLVRTLEQAGQGHAALRIELEPILKRLRDDRIDLAARWMVPSDADAATARRLAQEALERLGDLSAVWDAARQRAAEGEQRLFRTPQAIGYLIRTGERSWSCRTNWKPEKSRTMAVIDPGDGEQPGTFRVIGQADQEQLKLQSWIDPSLTREGRLIFAIDAAALARSSSRLGANF